MLELDLTHDIYYIIPVFLLSMLVASIIYKPVFVFACKYKIYDAPDERKLQRKPIPVMGGFVVFIGAMVSLLCYWLVRDGTPILPVEIAMIVLLLAGAWDDVKNLTPRQKFAVEILVVVAMAIANDYGINDFHGLWGIHEVSPWVSWPLTVVACVGIINAINMIDGIDGLSSGICIMILLFFSWMLFCSHDFVHAALGVALAGGLIPFFIMNVFGRSSKMFIGDAGTMMLGIAICDLMLAMLTKDSLTAQMFDRKKVCLMAFALAVLAVPIFDTLRVMIGRIMRGRSPFRPDRSHLHHAFIAYGFHHLETSLLEIILNMLIIYFWMLLDGSHLPMELQLIGVIVAGLTVTVGLYWLLVIHTPQNKDEST